ncbi:hypothetical protein BGZ73_006716 [Actinomortierella ambigua]|nr:hypothetical protein BGZ73_006716 [Actinomortierella ambigua]
MLLTIGATVAACSYAAYSSLQRRVKGSLQIQSSDMLYDKEKYGHIIDYDQYSFIVHGQRTMILSGEFHYWRLPDRDRWESVLRQYRAAGLNCIRIYFHWGFHSPAEGQYDFTGNRDIDYLLSLCEKIGLYVLAAPGPYICAETQGGGFPIWLVAKRDIRLRHLKTNFWKVYDTEFMKYCAEYFQHILPILARHQITQATGTNTGCILGLQLENESFQTLFGYPIGMHDDMRALAHYARDHGMTVPFFSNDAWEQGSFIVKDGSKYKKDFGLDLYGFDKYVVFTPNSDPSSWLIDRDQAKMPDWEPSTVISELDGMEKKVRSFGHAAAKTPIFIPELQGGWFNHYGLNYTYDTIYNYYGDQYTKMLLDTVTSQGCTMANYYMFYGGTNWGTIGDADVYTSYDYSACIREYGFMSGRCRKLRLGLLFLQSFTDITAQTEAIKKKQWTVLSDLDNVICQQRVSVNSELLSSSTPNSESPSSSGVELTYLRNFSKNKSSRFQLIALDRMNLKRQAEVVRLECCLPYKASFTALGNYSLPKNPDIHLLLSAAPIYIRSWVGDREVWIVGMAETGPTELAFLGSACILAQGGDLEAKMDLCGSNIGFSVQKLSVQSHGSQGYVLVGNAGGSADNALHIVFLDQATLMTLYGYFDNDHYAYAHDKRSAFSPSTPRLVAWGAYSTHFNAQKRVLEVDALEKDRALHIIAFDRHLQTLVQGSHSDNNSSLGAGLPYSVRMLHSCPVQGSDDAAAAVAPASWVRDLAPTGLPLSGPWESRAVDFGKSFGWIACPKKPNSNEFEKVALDYKYTSGHVIYRGHFKTVAIDPTNKAAAAAASVKPVKLKVNMRHRVTVYVNGVAIGSHMVYSRQLLMPGAKVGHDPSFFGLGSHTFTIPSEVLALKSTTSKPGDDGHIEHEIILVIDSVGLSRGPFVVNDFRNPRGLLSAEVIGPSAFVVKGSEHWDVAGVDVTTLANPYGSTGFPDEHVQEGWVPHLSGSGSPYLDPRRGVTWWRARFEAPPLSPSFSDRSLTDKIQLHMPLRLHIEGEFSAMILLNQVLVGRYFGSDSPQHDFYLMDGLLRRRKDADGGVGPENELQLLIYGSQEIDSIHVQILPWVIESDDGDAVSRIDWSGNLASLVASDTVAQGIPFFTIHQEIPV